MNIWSLMGLSLWYRIVEGMLRELWEEIRDYSGVGGLPQESVSEVVITPRGESISIRTICCSVHPSGLLVHHLMSLAVWVGIDCGPISN
jgi:hypothetical protein